MFMRQRTSEGHNGRAFTLVELLVVIGIIAVLIAILLPALAKARAAAQSLQCAGGMRELGVAIRLFASEHDDRAPGSAQEPSSVSWDDILNREHFKLARYSTGGIRVSSLRCPTYIGVPSGRALAMNGNVNGGVVTALLPGGPYGLAIFPPTSVESYYTKSYRLGAKLSLFRRSSETFLLIEHERTSDTTVASYPYNDAYSSWYLGDDPKYPAWSGDGGNYAFRHSNYTRGNFLFIDGHVEALTPGDEINTQRRFAP